MSICLILKCRDALERRNAPRFVGSSTVPNSGTKMKTVRATASHIATINTLIIQVAVTFMRDFFAFRAIVIITWITLSTLTIYNAILARTTKTLIRRTLLQMLFTVYAQVILATRILFVRYFGHWPIAVFVL